MKKQASKSPNGFHRTAVLIAGLAMLFSCQLVGCKREPNTFAPPPPPTVSVAHAIERSVTRYVESTGTTEAFESVELRARVPGFLDQVLFKPGSMVKKGDLLFVIDKRTYQARVAAAEATLAQNQAELTWATADFNRAEELKATKVASQLEWEQKKSTMEVAQAKVAAAKAALESAKLDLEFCEVRAPIDGRITKNLVDVGNLVGASGQPTILAVIVSARPMYVTIDSSESDWTLVRNERLATAPQALPGEIAPGVWRPVNLATAGETEFTVHGRIDYVDPALNPLTGTIRVRCRFENDDERLVPGMFVRLRVLLKAAPAVLAPDVAVLSDQSGHYVLIVDDKNVVEARHVKVGVLDGSMRVVTEGLSPSDRIVVNGIQRARPGATVDPKLVEIPATTQPATLPTTQVSWTPELTGSGNP